MLLDEFAVDVSGSTVSVTGLAANADEQLIVSSMFDARFPDGFDGSAAILSGPRILAPDTIDAVLSGYANCGPLRLSNPPPLGYALNEAVIVKGRLADEFQQELLLEELVSISGSRSIEMQTEILNPALCRMDEALPFVRSGGFDVRFGWGTQPGVNETGDYFVGENPVIDIKIPDLILDGFLRVSIVDVKGVVYHLLPNLGRPDSNIETLLSEVDDGFLRVTYPVEGSANDRLAFLIDDSTLGLSQIIVLYSNEQLFDQLRPVTESVASYAEAIEQARSNGDLLVRSLDTAFLNTARAE